MSRARNSLLFTTLGPSTSWVLWLDSDIVETPPTLIQDLALHDKPIIVPNCFQRYLDPETKKMAERGYDLNSWQDSEIAQKLGETLGPDDILLEGYAEMQTYRTLMAKLDTKDGDVNMEIPLDGVGGTVLLVKAEVHRDGAMFPPFAFYHLIETEGFAKMARRLGWMAYGLPNYRVCLPPTSPFPQIPFLPALVGTEANTSPAGLPLQRVNRSGTASNISSAPLLDIINETKKNKTDVCLVTRLGSCSRRFCA